MLQTIRDIVAQALLAKGWSVSNSTAIALKSYDTAVGKKEAHAYVSQGDAYHITLFGAYYSEGRNILEPSGQLISILADEATVRAAAEFFAASVDNAVVTSYAGRLLNK